MLSLFRTIKIKSDQDKHCRIFAFSIEIGIRLEKNATACRETAQRGTMMRFFPSFSVLQEETLLCFLKSGSSFRIDNSNRNLEKYVGAQSSFLKGHFACVVD